MKIRSFLIPTPGNIFIQGDLSQAESWIVAYSAKNENMIWSLNNSDIHVNTAEDFDDLVVGSTPLDQWKSGLWKLKRYTAKRCNHAFAYRMTAPRFVQVFNKDAIDMHIPAMSNKDGNTYRNKWLKRYALKSWWDEIEQTLGVTHTLTTPYGRIRSFFAAWGQELFKEATAFIPQSTVADHFNGAVQPELGIEGGLLKLWSIWKDRCKFVNQSHDSCIVDIHPSMQDDYIGDFLKYIRRPIMIKDVQFTIPASIEVGDRWGDLEEIKDLSRWNS